MYSEDPLLFDAEDGSRHRMRICKLSENEILVAFPRQPPSGLQGKISVFANTSLYSWHASLAATQEYKGDGHYFVGRFPSHADQIDRRRTPRFGFDRQHRDIAVHLIVPRQGFIPEGESKYKFHELLPWDISATGIQVEHPHSAAVFVPKLDLEIFLYIVFRGIEFHATCQIVRVGSESVGLKFLDVETDTKLAINRVIVDILEKQRHALLTRGRKFFAIKERLRWLRTFNGAKADKDQLCEELFDLVRSMVGDIAVVCRDMVGQPFELGEPRLDMIHKGIYDMMAAFKFSTNPVKGKVYLCFPSKIMEGIGLKNVELEDPDKLDHLMQSRMKVMANMIEEQQKHASIVSPRFHLEALAHYRGRIRTLGELSNQLFLRMPFHSAIGDFDLNLTIEDLQPGIIGVLDETEKAFLFQRELMESIDISTRKLFGGFLGVTCAKRGLELSKQLKPKFPTAALVRLVGARFIGMVVVTFSNKVALGVHQAMVGETMSSITPEVYDTIGELVNLIAGNAKQYMLEGDMNFHVSPPLIPPDREALIALGSNKAFLQMTYSSSLGLFEVCVTVHARKKSRES